MGVDLGMDGELFPFKLRDYQKIPIHFIKRIVFLINNNWILFFCFVLFNRSHQYCRSAKCCKGTKS